MTQNTAAVGCLVSATNLSRRRRLTSIPNLRFLFATSPKPVVLEDRHGRTAGEGCSITKPPGLSSTTLLTSTPFLYARIYRGQVYPAAIFIMPTAVHQQQHGPRVVVSNMEGLSAEDFETASIRSAAPSYVSDVPSYHSALPHNEPTPPYSPPERPLASGRDQHGSSPTSLLAPADSNSAPSVAARGRLSTAAALVELEHAEAEERSRPRPLEDPYLVGEEAARKARAERLARENGESILQMEDRRWDLFLAQMRTWDGGNRRRGAVARRMGMR